MTVPVQWKIGFTTPSQQQGELEACIPESNNDWESSVKAMLVPILMEMTVKSPPLQIYRQIIEMHTEISFWPVKETTSRSHLPYFLFFLS